ncbi:hypothetical protein HZA38_02750 [Candidatus Peregrinibacteria bacterium]|nr:hypothetical protein [Candidatus Peregrinibacteria bacterium]
MKKSVKIKKLQKYKSGMDFSDAMKAENIYTDDFLESMKEAENDVKSGNVKEYTKEEFLDSLS